ncbi:DUF1120 domain-containing protein [Pseudomonas sp. Y39-6]|jgi:type 1 fimbria pilin|nr:DUF1120 domain-containing protein [Pseudomonas veronii]QPO19036.1 DUF1120 domain-containing protein [Pseudomonas sp. Y39-6]RTY80414.1 DUF1120 domain-containing protein [Pseudomonas veronii]RWA28886.1 DUF1120 domain-containing protein [Pseudomonas veronii]URS62154.1 DUF1120 domain-containing protein [Pseudomonas sp. Y39-6]
MTESEPVMQPSRVLVAAAFLLAGVSNVMAASSVDISVVGTIIPSACTPTLSDAGTVDYGKISINDFPRLGEMVLPAATINLEVTCDAPTLMAVRSLDNRAGTAAVQSPSHDPLTVYGLGLASGGQKIGRYELKMNDVTADEQPRVVIESIDKETWFAADNATWQPRWLRTVSNGNIIPVAVTTLKTDLMLSTVLAPKDSLPGEEEIQIDGSATLDVIYL